MNARVRALGTTDAATTCVDELFAIIGGTASVARKDGMGSGAATTLTTSSMPPASSLHASARSHGIELIVTAARGIGSATVEATALPTGARIAVSASPAAEAAAASGLAPGRSIPGRAAGRTGYLRITICKVDNQGPPEVFYANGSITDWLSQSNRVLRYSPPDSSNPYGRFTEDHSLGFHFDSIVDLTETINCMDADGNGTIDAVLLGNTGLRNWFYVRQR